MVSPEFAYIDPGTGSLILQAVIGGVAAALVFAKFWWGRLLHVLHIRRFPERDESTSPAPVRDAGNGTRVAEQRSEADARR
jgi:hypothetical protein